MHQLSVEAKPKTRSDGLPDKFPNDEDRLDKKDRLKFTEYHQTAVMLNRENLILLVVDKELMNETYVEIFREAAEKHKNDGIHFAWANLERNETMRNMMGGYVQEQAASMMGIEAKEMPILTGVDGEKRRTLYLNKRPETLTVEEISNYVKEINAGNGVKYFKS